jgi:hypothetical protein
MWYLLIVEKTGKITTTFDETRENYQNGTQKFRNYKNAVAPLEFNFQEEISQNTATLSTAMIVVSSERAR